MKLVLWNCCNAGQTVVPMSRGRRVARTTSCRSTVQLEVTERERYLVVLVGNLVRDSGCVSPSLDWGKPKCSHELLVPCSRSSLSAH
jgi:hypothetical protein